VGRAGAEPLRSVASDRRPMHAAGNRTGCLSSEFQFARLVEKFSRLGSPRAGPRQFGLPTGAARISTTGRFIRSQTDFLSWSRSSAMSLALRAAVISASSRSPMTSPGSTTRYATW
jgi:hypothetical protein